MTESKRQAWKARLASFVEGWWFALLVAVLLGAVGIYLATSELAKASSAFRIGFAALCVTTILASAVRERALHGARVRFESNLRTALEVLPALVRSQPPLEFQSKVAEIVHRAAYTQREAKSPEDAVLYLQVLLQQIAILALSFENAPAERADGFAANLMLYVEQKAMAPWVSQIRFAGKANPESSLFRGILVLRTHLSRTAGGNASSYPDLALLVPTKPENEDGKYDALPGAPLAFARGTPEIVDVDELPQWAKENGNFEPKVISELKKYFESRPGHGFLSIPVPAPEPTKPPIAVINVDWQRANLLCEPKPGYAFAQAIAPLLTVLGHFLVEQDGAALLDHGQ